MRHACLESHAGAVSNTAFVQLGVHITKDAIHVKIVICGIHKRHAPQDATLGPGPPDTGRTVLSRPLLSDLVQVRQAKQERAVWQPFEGQQVDLRGQRPRSLHSICTHRHPAYVLLSAAGGVVSHRGSRWATRDVFTFLRRRCRVW